MTIISTLQCSAFSLRHWTLPKTGGTVLILCGRFDGETTFECGSLALFISHDEEDLWRREGG